MAAQSSWALPCLQRNLCPGDWTHTLTVADSIPMCLSPKFLSSYLGNEHDSESLKESCAVHVDGGAQRQYKASNGVTDAVLGCTAQRDRQACNAGVSGKHCDQRRGKGPAPAGQHNISWLVSKSWLVFSYTQYLADMQEACTLMFLFAEAICSSQCLSHMPASTSAERSVWRTAAMTSITLASHRHHL